MIDESENFAIKAESLFLIIVGQKNIMEQLLNNINKKNMTDKYILTQISVPSAKRSLELMQIYNKIEDDSLLNSTTQKPVLVDDGVEYAHAHTYGNGLYCSDNYMLQHVIDNDTHYTLSFLKFPLDEDDNPEILIEAWFKKVLNNVPYGIKKNTKLVTMAGSQSNILVISTELKKL
jgi:hypothetical protein